ncbi:MAG TPA: GNAT family N-acetyltransferase, partial [Roseiflexaceae bacterium]|nr:GNAT family N-acetyltransferase [Roseiflexaceae bacterium]
AMLDLTTAFAAFPVLETEHLVLRALTPDDAEALFAIMSDPKVIRYFGALPMTERRQAAERIEQVQADFRQQNGIRWAITRRGDDRLIGSCGFWRLIKPHFRAELGYDLSPDWWGRGIMPEAAGAALEFAFTAMGLHSVEAHIHPANIGSRRVLEKLRFAQEGYFRENYYDVVEERFTDTAIFSLLKSEFEGSKK